MSITQAAGTGEVGGRGKLHSRKRIARLMREQGPDAHRPRRYAPPHHREQPRNQGKPSLLTRVSFIDAAFRASFPNFA